MRLPLFLLAPILCLRADEAMLLKSSLAKLQAKSPEAIADVEPGSPVERAAMKLTLAGPDSNWRVSYLAAEWLLQAYLLRSRLEPVPAVTRERRDLEQAWKLITVASDQSRRTIVPGAGAGFYRGSDPRARSEAARSLSNQVGQERVPAAFAQSMDTLALEIAVRLEDANLMATALEPILQHPQLQPRDKTFALMAAAHSGHWEKARTWCQQLTGTPVLKALHERAQERPDGFDYSVMAFDDLGTAPRPTAPPLAAELQVKEFRIRLVEVQGETAAASRIREAYATNWHSGESAVPILRRGALARWQAPGDHTPTLTGACDPGHMRLLGYQDLPEGGRRIDTLDLKPDGARPNTWIGTLQSDRPSGAERIRLRFEAELDLR